MINVPQIHDLVTPEEYKGEALVGFIDLLGFTPAVTLNWNNESNSLIKRMKELHEKADYYISDVKELNLLDIELKTIIAKVTLGKVVQISDSFLIMIPTNNENYRKFLNSVISISSSICHIWREAILRGFTIRGAVSIGPMFWDKRNFIGPTFIEVFENEKNAGWSRVIISKKIVDRIRLSLKEINDKTIEKYFDRQYLFDFDHHLFLNPHFIVAHNTRHRSIILDKLIKIRDSSPDGVKPKYTHLVKQLKNSMYDLLEEYGNNKLAPHRR